MTAEYRRGGSSAGESPSAQRSLLPAARCVMAIDPGSTQSAWLVLNPATFGIRSFAITPNEELLEHLRTGVSADVNVVAIEWIESFGMAVGREVFETVHWSGRFTEAIESRRGRVVQLPRRTVKLHLCGSPRAKDPNIRQALVDRFGGSAAKGTKAKPGPLYGVANDVWSALAIAVTHAETSDG